MLIKYFEDFNTAAFLAVCGFFCLGGLGIKYPEARTAFIAVSGGTVTGYLAQMEPRNSSRGHKSGRDIQQLNDTAQAGGDEQTP